MILFIDESGNTGETLGYKNNFNFEDQPYYCLAGIIADDGLTEKINNFIKVMRLEHRLKEQELKAKKIYSSRSAFLFELIDFLLEEDVPIFIELMDKKFYLNVQLIQYFIIPFHSIPLTDINNQRKYFIASEIGNYLNQEVYSQLIITCKNYTNDSLEDFYEFLINYFEEIGHTDTKINIIQTREDYYEMKKVDRFEALKKSLPIPDTNPHNRHIHLLPNYNAFTNLLARSNKYAGNIDKSLLKIVHDEQRQFDVIFESALDLMKNIDFNNPVKDTIIEKINDYDFNADLHIEFIDSKKELLIQIADVLAGFVMRFWQDFMKANRTKVEHHLPSFKKIYGSIVENSTGINFMVPYYDHQKLGKI